jgi:hypothetical protein
MLRERTEFKTSLSLSFLPPSPTQISTHKGHDKIEDGLVNIVNNTSTYICNDFV